MIVKHICKLTQVVGRLRLVPNPREYCHLAPLKRTSYWPKLGLRSLCFNAADHNVAWTAPPAPSSSSRMFWAFSSAFMLNLFGGSDEKEETPEDKLVKTIKRSILCIQREQYDKAEQMLHLALRMAQDIQSKDGITYVFDLMANLAMEREQFKKAEKIFTDVMKRLFADGHTEESPKILHISSKIAHMSQLQGDLEKSFQGFTWTLQQLAKLLEKMPEDKDILELYGLTKNWFGQLLMKQGKYLEAKNLFKEAFDTLIDVYGAVNDASVTILNNISVAYVNLEKYTEARETLLQAMELTKELKDATQEGILQANLGLVYLREGLMKQAENACRLAWKLGKQYQNPDAIEQAEYCLNEIKTTLNGAKRQ
ncbi:tetratricopeptide repeat protein 19 homolog, mitochondrial isoform X1 [Drosophila eugracilis]|uniref:tetratricopeptide repeat protein 19 homolog, mitochondrial isoform X1 n=1 Tax=Drosophila eugracilis TaxID=29029 RepID=UPI001BDAA545|nr:tetratricopeptide repeat protein 19 homolog, mitochondrial isoform X1 [Drosophila eugracilis]